MKFKVTVIGLLTAILAVCCFTSYRLIQEAERQTTFSRIAAYAGIELYDKEFKITYKMNEMYVYDSEEMKNEYRRANGIYTPKNIK